MRHQDFYAVLGHPIAHSKSPQIHKRFAQDEGINLDYRAICLPKENFKESLLDLIRQGLKGANVTLPFKEEAYSLCDELSEEASVAGAVNTLTIDAGRVYGHNTDGLGLVHDLRVRHHIALKDKRILIVGAGGAARGIIHPLMKAFPKEIVVTNRTFVRAENLIGPFQMFGEIRAIPWELLNEPFDLIINATSSSISGQFTPLPNQAIFSETIGYDLMYQDVATVFMDYIHQQRGKVAYDGLGMLVEQAALSFERWHHVYPSTLGIYTYLRG